MKSSLSMSSSFKRAVVLSVFIHIVLFALIGFSNQLAGPRKTGMVHYVNLNFVSLPGGGGGGGGGSPRPAGEQPGQPAPAAQKESMKELTVPQKTPAGSQSALRHPVEEAKPTAKKPATVKKTEISAPQPGVQEGGARGSETGQAGGTGTGGSGGSGLRIGVGEGPGGFGSGYGDPTGTSSFPFTYYLQIIIDRVSSNWFNATSHLDYSGEYQSVIYFKILRNGQIADLKIEQPSELAALDLTARRAVELAAPFPPLPRDFENDYLVVHLIFERSK